ncbi:MAG: tetratricopeptide repeat protein [Chlorobium sp.]|uniref:tetratricopeptide repeat protein n=1 Tax=Chlorobium sp. TaxID=1095 RepID=UPI002F42D9C7
MDWKWNHIRIEGNNNLVLQDVDGNTTTIAITAFIEIFTKEKDARIEELRGWLIDKEKLERFADADRTRMQAELQKLQEENAILEERIPILLQEFNNKDISRTDALYQEAFALFMNGKVDEALDVLDDAKLNAKKQELKHEQQKLAETFLLKADLLQLKFDFKSAAKNFEEALSIAPVWANYLKAANFHQFLNDFLPAENLYTQALALVETPDEKATTLNNLANLQKARNEFEAAELGYREALQIRRELAATNPQAFLPYVATTLNNLAALQSDKNEFEAAELGYREALGIYRELAATNPQAYLPYVAGTLNNLALLQKARNKFEDAELGYREALGIYRELVATNPQAFLPDVAMTLINLGIFYLQSAPERDKSVACIAEALQILKPLTARIPYLQQYQATALQVASAWEIDPDELLKSL